MQSFNINYEWEKWLEFLCCWLQTICFALVLNCPGSWCSVVSKWCLAPGSSAPLLNIMEEMAFPLV